MRRTCAGLVLLLLAGVLAPSGVDAQRGVKRPSDNVQTRSAALYLKSAREKNDPQEAREMNQQALDVSLEGTRRDADNPKTWYLAGVAYVRLGDYAGADSVFDRATQLYPQYEEVEQERENAWIQAYNAGVVALQQNKLEEAEANLKRADLIYDKRPTARLNLGSIYHRLGRPEDAIAAYKGAVEILRGPARQGLSAQDEAQWTEWEEVAVFNMAQLLATNDRDAEATEAYREFLAREPDNIQAQVNLAVVLTRQERGDEAAQVYEKLLTRGDLSDADYESIGVGLFRAKRYAQAAEAFRKAMAANPYHRDAMYNLAQALFLEAAALEPQFRSASGAQKQEVRQRLTTMYEELIAVTQRVRELDPFNQNAMRLLAQGYRGTADVTAEAGAGEQFRRKALAVLEEHRDLAFEIDDVRVTPAQGSVTVEAIVTNHKVAAGQPIAIRVSLLGPDGSTVASRDVTVTAPAADQEAELEVEIPVDREVAGWKITRAS